MNRIDRISAILIQLQSRKVVKAQHIADRFGISLRTVYRDIQTLNEAGVPVIGEAGVGYSLGEGYRLPPVMFTMEEAMAFLTAGKLAEKLTDQKTAAAYSTALMKIRAILRSTEKDYLENIEEHISVLYNPRLPVPEAGNNYLQQLLFSIAQQIVLQMQYATVGTGEKSKREIEPLGLYFMSGRWYLIAWCRLRKDYRNFRVDCIQSLKETNKAFEHQHPSLQAYLGQLKKQERELHEIVIRVPRNTLSYLGDQKYYMGYVSQRDYGEQTELQFLSASPRGFARWLLLFGDQAEIVKPASLRHLVVEQLEKLVKKFK